LHSGFVLLPMPIPPTLTARIFAAAGMGCPQAVVSAAFLPFSPIPTPVPAGTSGTKVEPKWNHLTH
ncbi:MAG: hypothetical protein R3E93_16595, partial [Thiothrix sp.]